MRRLILGAMALALGCAPTALSTASAQVTTGGGTSTWVGGSPLRTEVHVGEDGTTWVGVWVDAPAQGRTVRAPMDVALVVDTSGSMAGDKIRNARMAASSLVETLADGDIVSLYAFSNQVRELAPPTRLGRQNRASIMASISRLEAGGGTAMYAGVETGLARLTQAPATHPVRRVVLISDGQANVGPSDPGSFGQLAARYSEFGAQVSAIGVGLDYDESTLGQLAVRSAGRLYHLEQPSQMASILEQEVQRLAQTVATNAVIEVIPAQGVTLIEADTMGAQIRNGHLVIPVGALYGGQRREVLFRARLSTAALGRRSLADVRLQYALPGQARTAPQVAHLDYTVAPQGRAVAEAQPRVAAMVASREASQAQLQAAQMLNRGEGQAAAAALDAAAQRLEVAARSTSDRRARRRMRRQAAQTRAAGGRARAARSAPAARAAALDSFDSAYEAQGY